MRLRSTALPLLALGALLVAPATARAVFTVDVSPPASTLPSSQTSPSFRVAWTVTWEIADVTPPIVSASGTFVALPGNQVLGSSPGAFTIPGPPDPVPPTVDVFRETVRVPAEILARARALGATSIRYERTFQGSFGATNENAVLLSFSGGLAGPFQVLYARLTFDDDSPIRVTEREARLRAHATLSYSGTGTIEAAWDVAESGSTAGAPVFRELQRVRRYLTAGSRVQLRSPELPTRDGGLHLVRLRLLEPDAIFDLPVIRYFVREGGEVGEARAPVPVRVSGPPHLAPLERDTRFAWQPVEGASAYRVEIYASPRGALPESPDEVLPPQSSTERSPDEGELVTGALVAGNRSGLVLTPAARDRLRPGDRYAWRVLALAPDGSTLGRSPLFDLLVPLEKPPPDPTAEPPGLEGAP